ncbi:MAG: YjjG family noncanonical pyrimidine nucleotidase [Erysipelotrichaceae bacterium]|nr:YjjG family noncanonical pyrimidine nucleotidase [Erysipelotrichaceae bacterium]
MKKILLFDADGTLFDFHAAEADALNQLLEKINIQDKDSALNIYHQINDALWKRVEEGTMTQTRLKLQRFEEFKEALKLDVSAEMLAETFMEALSKGTQLIDYAYETLEILYKNYDCHIVTNGITRIQKGRMQRSELKPFIKELFISEEMGVSKPDVRYFDLVKEKLNPDPDDLLIVIGDSLSSDMKGAVDSGLKAIWYNPNHLPDPSFLLDGIVDDLRKLPSIIQQI